MAGSVGLQAAAMIRSPGYEHIESHLAMTITSLGVIILGIAFGAARNPTVFGIAGGSALVVGCGAEYALRSRGMTGITPDDELEGKREVITVVALLALLALEFVLASKGHYNAVSGLFGGATGFALGLIPGRMFSPDAEYQELDN